jgi:hypothetical protein
MSAFAKAGIDLIDAGYSAIPILPGEKRPGRFVNQQWVGMSGWQKYCSQLPTRFEYQQWEQWPDAGVGLALGEKSGVVAGDFDYGSPEVRAAVEAVLPPSPVRKRGAKGYISFFRYSGEKPKKWFINNESVFELLSHGNQTVMPPSLHPDGMTYTYLTNDSLLDVALEDLPRLPEDIHARITAALQPFMDDTDRERNERDVKRSDPDPDGAQTIWQEINETALLNLSLWVPRLFPDTKQRHDGSYRVIAHWRGVENPNVSIHPEGIMDWGAGKGHTAIDVVMLASSCDLETAANTLKGWLRMTSHVDLLDTMPDISLSAVRESPKKTVILDQIHKSKAFDKPPGILGDICEWMELTAPRPQPTLYLGAALAMLGAVMGRKYETPSGLRSNIYCIGIAPSGAGKNHAINCVDRLLTEAMLDNYLGGSKIGSGPAMIAAVSRQPAILFQLDEFGMMMGHMADSERAPAHLRQILDNMTELYSAANRKFRGIEYADENRERREIEHPNMCIHGLSTPGSFYNSLSSANSLEGSLSRLLIFQTEDIPYAAKSRTVATPKAVLAHLQQIHEIGEDQVRGMGNVATQQHVPSPMTVPVTNEAQAYIDERSRDLVDQQREITNTVAEPILTRIMENALKIALIGAGSIDPVAPKIDLSLIHWAYHISERCADTITRHIIEHMADNKIEAERKRIKRIIMKAGGLTKSDLVLRTRWLERRRREEILADMVEHGELTAVIEEGRTKPITKYKVK